MVCEPSDSPGAAEQVAMRSMNYMEGERKWKEDLGVGDQRRRTVGCRCLSAGNTGECMVEGEDSPNTQPYCVVNHAEKMP